MTSAVSLRCQGGRGAHCLHGPRGGNIEGDSPASHSGDTLLQIYFLIISILFLPSKTQGNRLRQRDNSMNSPNQALKSRQVIQIGGKLKKAPHLSQGNFQSQGTFGRQDFILIWTPSGPKKRIKRSKYFVIFFPPFYTHIHPFE